MRIYERYGPAVLRKAQRMLRSESDAQDLTQALFVDLWQQGRHGVGLGYLYRAISRRCLNFLRDGRNRARLLDAHGDSLRPGVATGPEARVLGVELLATLAERLPTELAETFVYHEIDDMTQEEIASLMGVSRRTVGKRLSRAQAQVAELQSQLADGGA